MKSLISFAAFIALFNSQTQGQTFAVETQSAGEAFTHLSTVGLQNSRHPNRKMVIGTIVAGTGGLVLLTGAFMLAAGTESTYGEPPDTGIRDAGIAVMVAGFTTAMIGGIIAKKGYKEKKSRYSFQIISPKMNEIGLAYHF